MERNITEKQRRRTATPSSYANTQKHSVRRGEAVAKSIEPKVKPTQKLEVSRKQIYPTIKKWQEVERKEKEELTPSLERSQARRGLTKSSRSKRRPPKENLEEEGRKTLNRVRKRN